MQHDRLSGCWLDLTSLFNVSLGLPLALSLSPLAQVFVLIIIRSVLMLGLRTLGATTPHASDSLLFIERVHFLLLLLWLLVGGRVQGLPKAVLTLLWWLGAISRGRFATTKSSQKRSSTWQFFFADVSTKTQDESWVVQYATASSGCTVLWKNRLLLYDCQNLCDEIGTSSEKRRKLLETQCF